MANMDISPEDREMLAKAKFSQWFDENFTEKFGNAFDGRLSEYAKLEGGPTTGTTTSGKTADNTHRRSLLGISLESVLGL